MSNFFHQGCTDNDLKMIKRVYFEADEPIYTLDEKGDTILHKAVRNNQYEIAEFLLSKNLFFNIENEYGLTPLDIALKQKNHNMLSLFAQHLDHKFISSVINSKSENVEMIEFLKEIIDYDKDVYAQDLLLWYHNENIKGTTFVDENGDLSTLFLEVLKTFILKENWAEVKKIVVDVYKNYNKKNHSQMLPVLNTYLAIKHNEVLIAFSNDLFDLSGKDRLKLQFNESVLRDLFAYGDLKAISYILQFYVDPQCLKKEYLSGFARGSVNVLKLLETKYTLNINKEMINDILLFNPNEDYLKYIQRKAGLSNYEITEVIVDFIFENDPFINDKIIELLQCNPEYAYTFNASNESLLNRIVNSDNYMVIKFLLDSFPFMINNYTENKSYALFDALNSDYVDIFELIATHHNTNLKVFDENINNILHYYVFNHESIKYKDEKFKILLSYIDDEMLLLANKNGNTPLFLFGKEMLVSEIKQMIELEIIDSENANYKVYNTSLLDLIDINVINRDKTKILNHTVDLGLLEDYVLEENIISLSKVLYLSELEENKRKDMTGDIVILSLINKSSNIDIIKMLAFYGVSVDGLNAEEIETPLIKAIKNNDVDTALFLLNSKCEINTQLNESDNSKTNSLILSAERGLDLITYLLLKEKIDVDLKILTHYPKYLKWKNLALLSKNREAKKITYVKELCKDSFFDKNPTLKYKIDKSDSAEERSIKKVLNIIDRSTTLTDLVAHCNNENIKIYFAFEKNKLSRIYFDNDLSNEDLGFTLEDIKSKINYNYFEYKKLKRS